MSFDIAKYPTLALVDSTQELRLLPKESLPKLCDELRRYLLDSVSRSSGHFASGLGTVELTVALHYVYNTPFDRLIWDVEKIRWRKKTRAIKQAARRTACPQDNFSSIRPARSPFATVGLGNRTYSVSGPTTYRVSPSSASSVPGSKGVKFSV